MSDRRQPSQPSTSRGLRNLSQADIPEPERSAVEVDLPRLQRWLREHPEVRASVALDRSAFDAGQGHVLLVVKVQGDPATVRRELEAVAAHPDRLRVRADRPSPEELHRVLRWVIDTRMTPRGGSPTLVTTAGVDDAAGVVVVTLNQRDQQYVDELLALTKGMVRVEPEPVNLKPLVPPRFTPGNRP